MMNVLTLAKQKIFLSADVLRYPYTTIMPYKLSAIPASSSTVKLLIFSVLVRKFFQDTSINIHTDKLYAEHGKVAILKNFTCIYAHYHVVGETTGVTHHLDFPGNLIY